VTRAAQRILLTAVMAVAAAAPVRAEPMVARFRGTVERAEPDRLLIRRASGSTLAVRMNPRTRIYAVNSATLRGIKPESYVGVLGAAGPEPRRAEAVTIYSPSERGFEAGSQSWDTKPGATFAAGWVADLRGGPPMRLTLGYGGGQASFEIPADTPVTQFSPGEKALLVPGAAVTVFARSEGDGALDAGTIAVGRQGVVPGL
jgi:membrane-associated protease RseP (regulator of RpoE activity)